MKLLGAHVVHSLVGDKHLELWQGDLANAPDEFRSDILVVSAFRDDYAPTPRSVIGSLDRNGLSVANLARDKAVDLRSSFGCWLSKQLPTRSGLPYQRLLCVERSLDGAPAETIADLFRSIEPFSFGPPFATSVAMPILSAGDQGANFDDAARSIFVGAWCRLSEGHLLNTVRVVVLDDVKAQRAARILDSVTQHTNLSANAGMVVGLPSIILGRILARAAGKALPKPDPTPSTDVFISYSRVDAEAARLVASHLTAAGLSVFIDEQSINVGVSWQQEIFDALERCRCALVLYSPDFLSSKVCKDEFSAALILRRRRGDDFIFPVLVRDVELPAYMEMLNYSDCRISDVGKLGLAAKVLANRLRAA